jgi:predicted O-linked N-acetylglucosamine transferase (SPINDLY family)
VLAQLLRSLRGRRAVAHNEAGIRRWVAGDLAGAEAAFRRALAAEPAHAPACSNLGMVVWDQRRLDEAMTLLVRAVRLDPAHVGARLNLANALLVGNRMEDGIAQLREVLRLDPGNAKAHGSLLKPLLDVCDWDGAGALAAELAARWTARPDDPLLAGFLPFTTLLVPLPPDMRLDLARRYAARVSAAVGGPLPARPVRAPGGRVRLAYASADFHNHATAHLAAGLFERHDRGRFEVIAYSYGIDDGSAYRARLAAAFDRFVDVRADTHRAIAERIARDGVDILVDLKGHTGEARPEIFALRPAPVQVNYLGYPGTTGAAFIDYIVADRVVIPEEDRRWFSERVAYLPASYQVNDDRQPIAAAAPSRAACGLPEAGFVFCSFNKHYKIERAVFDAWMRILAAVPGSVLWLLGGHGERRLRAAAAARGVDPARLVFAGKLPKPEHLARHRLADLFLDTHHVNAHTTAADALWAGLPLLTFPGASFAGRVAASLLHAIGVPDLIVPSLAAYEERAIELARAPGELAALRRRLEANRRTRPLFDTGGFARDLERAFERMHQVRVTGRPPEGFAVEPA